MKSSWIKKIPKFFVNSKLTKFICPATDEQEEQQYKSLTVK
jgi:hypothetical protein